MTDSIDNQQPQERTDLRQWMKNRFEVGWDSVETHLPKSTFEAPTIVSRFN